MRKRYPDPMRGRLYCKYCFGPISYQSKKGRCRSCYNQHRRPAQEYKVRSANRPNSGTSYRDKDGIIRYAWEMLPAGLTVASAWACLMRSWRAFRIVSGKGDHESIMAWMDRIHYYAGILNLKQNAFTEFIFAEEPPPEATGIKVFVHEPLYQDSPAFASELTERSGDLAQRHRWIPWEGRKKV